MGGLYAQASTPTALVAGGPAKTVIASAAQLLRKLGLTASTARV